MMKLFLYLPLLFTSVTIFGQKAPQPVSTNDSTRFQGKNLPEITVVGRGSKSDYQQMPEIVGTNIYAGKKSTLLIRA